jgi:ABC-type glycerol-3-phosphate transport system substrate-binding protein
MSQQRWSRRRFLQTSGLFATLLSTNLLAACATPAAPAASGEQAAGSDAPAAAGASLRVMARAGFAGDAHREFAKRYTEQTGVEVITEDINYNDLFTKTLALGAVNDLQDLIFGHSRWSPYVAYKGLLLDLDPLVEADGPDVLDVYFPSVIAEMRGPGTDGKLMYLPDFMDVSPTSTVYMNLDLLEKAGVEPPTDASWTMADLAEMATKTSDPDNGVYGLSGLITDKESALQSWTRGWGQGEDGSEDSWVLSPDGKTIRLGDEWPVVKEALSWWWDLVDAGVIATSDVMASVEGGADALFSNGQIAFRIFDTSDTFNLTEMVGDRFKFASILKPLGPYGHRGSCIEAGRWSVNATTEHPQEAYELTKLYTGEECARWTFENLKRSPLSVVEVWNDPSLAEVNPMFAVAREWLLAGADPFPMPANLRGPELRDVIRNEMAAWNDGKETWEQMVAHAQPAIQEVLDLPMP